MLDQQCRHTAYSFSPAEPSPQCYTVSYLRAFTSVDPFPFSSSADGIGSQTAWAQSPCF